MVDPMHNQRYADGLSSSILAGLALGFQTTGVKEEAREDASTQCWIYSGRTQVLCSLIPL